MSYPEITFKDFSKLMVKRKRSIDDLVDLFRGKLDDNRALFERVMSCQWRNPETCRYEDRSTVVIPYRSVIEFYQKELTYLKDSKKSRQEVGDRRKTVSRARDFIEEFREGLAGYLTLNSSN